MHSFFSLLILLLSTALSALAMPASSVLLHSPSATPGLSSSLPASPSAAATSPLINSLPAAPPNENSITTPPAAAQASGPRFGPICETTTSSPRVDEIEAAATKLEARARSNFRCEVQNEFGSKCTKHVSVGGAAISVCGAWQQWLPCSMVGVMSRMVAAQCQWNGLAGGRVVIHDKLTIAVH
ncbi:hypothetical protein EDC01DRAFT_631230 [Geopyxis carbonaria]|nr:hypothetical protein EDC01DRAFT_631230 [Geopyxis carbonaria]